MSRNQNGILICFSSQNSSQNFFFLFSRLPVLSIPILRHSVAPYLLLLLLQMTEAVCAAKRDNIVSDNASGPLTYFDGVTL